MPLLFALLCFVIATPALLAAFAAAHVWLAATVLLRLGAGAYVRAVLWFCALVYLIAFDVSCVTPAHAYDLPQDYLDALPGAVRGHCADHFCGQQEMPTQLVPGVTETTQGRTTTFGPTMADAPTWLTRRTYRRLGHRKR